MRIQLELNLIYPTFLTPVYFRNAHFKSRIYTVRFVIIVIHTTEYLTILPRIVRFVHGTAGLTADSGSSGCQPRLC